MIDVIADLLTSRPFCTVAAVVCSELLLAHFMTRGFEVD